LREERKHQNHQKSQREGTKEVPISDKQANSHRRLKRG